MMMNSIHVSVRLIDGGLQEFHEGPAFLVRLRSLQARGIEGRELIHQLLTDDWAAPPTVVIISGIAPDGRRIDEVRIPYR